MNNNCTVCNSQLCYRTLKSAPSYLKGLNIFLNSDLSHPWGNARKANGSLATLSSETSGTGETVTACSFGSSPEFDEQGSVKGRL